MSETATINLNDLEGYYHQTGYDLLQAQEQYSKALSAKERPLRDVVRLEQAIKAAKDCPWNTVLAMLNEISPALENLSSWCRAKLLWIDLVDFVNKRTSPHPALIENDLANASQDLADAQARFGQASHELDAAKAAHNQAKSALEAARSELT